MSTRPPLAAPAVRGGIRVWTERGAASRTVRPSRPGTCRCPLNLDQGRTGRRFRTRESGKLTRLEQARESQGTAAVHTGHDLAFLGNVVLQAVAANA